MAGLDNRRPRSQGQNGHGEKKRKHEAEAYDGMRHTLSLRRQQSELEEFNLTSSRRPGQDEGSNKEDEAEDLHSADDWQTVENGRPKKKSKKIPKPNSSNYPAIKFSTDSRLQSQIKISDIQNLLLYILADGPSPQFVSIRHRPEIRKVVVLMVPGLEKSMFVEEKERDQEDRRYSPDECYPIRLKSEDMPTGLAVFAQMFEDLWPVKTPGDDKFGKMHSPVHAILTAPLPRGTEERNRKKKKKASGVQPAQEPAGWRNSRTPVTEFVHSPEELLENDYVLHPAAYDDEVDKIALSSHRNSAGVSQEHGWVDTNVTNFGDGFAPDNEIEQGSLTAGREILAMDCEMCMTGEGELSLARISIVSWDGSIILDELVKPAKPITNYLTQYSGITETMLENVTTSLPDIQKKLVKILHPRTILIGHSLNSDLTALKLTHPFIIDTAIIYPHPRGPPLKSSLKWLAQKYLNREIQKGHGTTGAGAGHDSIEDARSCLDLVKQKCEKGKEWGTSDAVGENIFRRIARAGVKYKNQGGSAIPSPINARSSAMVDWGDPRKGAGAAATHCIGCKTDEEVAEGIIRAVNGDPDGKEILGGGVDFVFGRLRELEALKGWWNNNKAMVPPERHIVGQTKQIETSQKAKADPHAFRQDGISAENDIKEATESKGDETEAVSQAIVREASAFPAGSSTSEFLWENRIVAVEDSTSNPVEVFSAELPSARNAETFTESHAPSSPASLSSMTAPTSSLPQFVKISPDTPISVATSDLVSRLQKIYNSLPPCTAFIIYSGSGDPRDMSRLQAMQTQFKKEYKIKKWDQLSVKWTDTEEQALRRAVREARNGIAFISVK